MHSFILGLLISTLISTGAVGQDFTAAAQRTANGTPPICTLLADSSCPGPRDPGDYFNCSSTASTATSMGGLSGQNYWQQFCTDLTDAGTITSAQANNCYAAGPRGINQKLGWCYSAFY
jgi:hypothetical protein